MARGRKTAKAAGTRLETQMARWLQWAFQDTRIVRPRLRGRADVGDVTGLHYMGDPVTIECKATANGADGSPRNVRAEFDEALREAANAGSPWPVLVKKRDRVTDRDWREGGRQLAIIRVTDLKALVDNLAPGLSLNRAALIDLPRNPRLTGMECAVLFTLLNHGLPLGPDPEETA